MCGGDWLRGRMKERQMREDAKIRVCMGKVSGCCCITENFSLAWRSFCYFEYDNSPSVFLFLLLYTIV